MKTQINRIKPSKPQFDIIISRQQVNLFLSGQGGGKTHCAGIVSANFISRFPKAHGFIGANTYVQLSDSTLFRIRKVWKEIYGWAEWSKENPSGVFVVDMQPPSHFNTKDHEYDSYHGKICFITGTVIYKGSLDNYKAHDGKEFAWAILDETKDTREEAVKEVITGRLRESVMFIDSNGELVDNKKGIPFNPLFIFTSPAKVQWLNEWFSLDQFTSEITEAIYQPGKYFKKDIGNKRAVVSSTYHNLENLPANFLENQKANLHSGLQDMLIYGNPFSNSGGEFYKCFNRTAHVKDIPYNKNIPLHISFDFNVNPYMTCTVWQIEGKNVNQIGEICLSNPYNTTAAICNKFIRDYNSHDAGLFVYGDPSGKDEDTRLEKGHNDFTIITKILSKFKPQLRLLSSHPPVAMRGNFINTIFEKSFEGLRISLDSKCPKSINDLVYLKEDAEGAKFKEKAKDPNTGVTCERYGHTSDSMDYFICRAFAAEFNRYQAGGSNHGLVLGKVPFSKNSY